MTSLELRYAALTDIGLRRTSNQDSGYASNRMLVVADGMGGAAAGDLASAEALGVIRQLDAPLEQDALAALEQSVRAANERLSTLIDSDPSVEGMGTTVEAMLFDGEKIALAHIGDSRSYRLRKGSLVQLSNDHTFVQSLVDEGRLTRAEAREHPHRSLLLRALLGRDDNLADLSWLQPQLGDRYLLCSDGLTDMVDDETIERVLGADSIEEAAAELVRLALENGGVDNVTVVIGEMVEAGTDIDKTVSLEPLVVGSAAAPPRRRTSRRGGHSPRKERLIDPEEERYAPRPPKRRGVARTLVGLLIAACGLALIGWAGLNWTQSQYYVSEHDGKVTIFRGINADLPGVSLHRIDDVSNIDLADLPVYQRERVRRGIEARSQDDAEAIVSGLRSEVVATPTPTPTLTPTPTPVPTPASTSVVYPR